MELEISDVIVGNRKRKLNESKVQSLAESFVSIGQLQPITVARKNGSYKLKFMTSNNQLIEQERKCTRN